MKDKLVNFFSRLLYYWTNAWDKTFASNNKYIRRTSLTIFILTHLTAAFIPNIVLSLLATTLMLFVATNVMLIGYKLKSKLKKLAEDNNTVSMEQIQELIDDGDLPKFYKGLDNNIVKIISHLTMDANAKLEYMKDMYAVGIMRIIALMELGDNIKYFIVQDDDKTHDYSYRIIFYVTDDSSTSDEIEKLNNDFGTYMTKYTEQYVKQRMLDALDISHKQKINTSFVLQITNSEKFYDTLKNENIIVTNDVQYINSQVLS